MHARDFTLALAAVLLLFGARNVMAGDSPTHPPLWGLAVWVGKLPDGSLDGKTPREFWDEPHLMEAADRGLGKGFIKKIIADETIKYWEVVRQKNDSLMLSYCVQHACGFDNILVLINMRAGTVSACLHGLGQYIGVGKTLDVGFHKDYTISNGQIRAAGVKTCQKIQDQFDKQ